MTAIALLVALPATALAQDADRDGIPDAADPCPHTLPGTRQLVPGCSSLDLIGRPDAVLAQARIPAEDIDQLARMPRFAGKPALASALASLNSARTELKQANDATRLGRPCDGQALADRAGSDLANAAGQLDILLRDSLADTSDQHGEDIPDFEVSDAELSERIDHLGQSRSGLATASGALGMLCRSSSPMSTRGTIVAFAADDSRVTLQDGRVFGLPVPRSAREPIWLNETVQMAAMDFGDKTGFASSIASDVGWNGGVVQGVSTCARLAFVPIQPMPPENGKPLLLHDPNGYNFSGTYRLESGMSIAASNVCKEPPNQINPNRYTIQVDITYQNFNNASITTTLAADLAAGDNPVPFPTDVLPGSQATLAVTYRIQHCLPGPPGWGCDQPQIVLQESYTALFTQRGGRCTAQFNAPEFDVNDQVPSDFRAAYATGFSMVPNPPIVPPAFEAQGYSITNNVSSFPKVAGITNNQLFAVHNTDFAAIYPASGFSGYLEALDTIAKHGVTHAAGLRWPHLRGKNNGWEYQFSCELPSVTRDVVNFCANGNAYYRLPFDQSDTSWTQGQGNNSLPTHQGNKAWAYDMVTSCGSAIITGRAGRVVTITQSNLWQHNPSCTLGNPASCCPAVPVSCGSQCCTIAWCNSNNVKVLHQDGTKGWYFHMPPNSVVPAIGGFVPRGGAVAVVGTIGNSSGAHLHFEANDTSAGRQTILAKFEASNPNDVSQKLTCYVPTIGDVLRSNNHAQ